jgi:2,4'-dihydroxyacetophenone dioxygenase
MTVTITPVPATTSSGAALPTVALPQSELLTINEKNIPVITDTLGPGVHVKPLRLDLEEGCWVVLAIFSPGTQLPVHYHTGIVDAYTLSGRWYYVEYPDQPQTAGSYMFEPCGSVHTLTCPATNTEDTVVLFRIEGANVNFTEDGQLHSILDATSIQHLLTQLTEARGLDQPNYLIGGEVSFTAQKT